MELYSYTFLVLLFTFGSTFKYPDELTLPINYFDYTEWAAVKDGTIAGVSRTSQEKTMIRERVSLRNSADDVQRKNGLMAAAACDFDICQVANHKTDCPEWSLKNYEDKIVDSVLSVDGLPQQKIENGARKEGVATKGLEYWYRNHTFSQGVVSNITLKKIDETDLTPIYRYDVQKNFHPLKGIVGTYYCRTASDASCKHTNYVFATHFKAFITYNSHSTAARSLEISSDDDSFLFIDKKIVKDWGGTRSPTTIPIELPTNGYTHGQKYQIDFFHADRCPTQSAFTVQGTFTCETFPGSNVDTDKDGVPDCVDSCPTNIWKVSVTPDCGCNDNCNACELVSSQQCSAVNGQSFTDKNGKSLNCETCYTGGPCQDAGNCECEQITDPTKCNGYTETSGGNPKCKWCKSGGTSVESCVPINNCECSYYNTLDTCKTATDVNYECRWCSGKCIDNRVNSERTKYCTCTDSSLNTKTKCLDILEKNFADPSCYWCTYDENGSGHCDTVCECSTFTDVKDAEKCKYLYASNSVDTSSQKNVKICKDCDPNDDGSSFYCIPKEAKCNSCMEQLTKESCLATDYTPGNTCRWCGGLCISEDKCPVCEEYKDKTQCEKATDEFGDSLKCGYCFNNDCRKKSECPDCDTLSETYRNDLVTLEEKCIASIHNRCHFCGNIDLKEDAKSPLNLCVPDVVDCPACAEIPPMEHKENTNSERNCMALRFIYSSQIKAPNDFGMQRCGYCEYTDTCVDLGSKIEEHKMLEDPIEQKAFVFENFCDSNCHNYDKSEAGCLASKKDCGWCELPNGTTACNSPQEECAHCSEYTSDFLCLASGCNWCDSTSECISTNFKCSSPTAIAAGVSAGVVAAIVIAAIVALVIASFASKKMYDAIMDARAASMDTATSNPLFEDDASGGVNPAFAAQ